MNSYILRPRPPRRALVLGCAASVIGVFVLLVGLLAGWPVVVVILGALVLAVGIAVLLLIAYSLAHHSLFVDLDDQGFHVHGPGLDRKGSWSRVTRVALTPDGSRLVIASGAIKRTYIICPNGGEDPVMKSIVADIAVRVSAVAS